MTIQAPTTASDKPLKCLVYRFLDHIRGEFSVARVFREARIIGTEEVVSSLQVWPAAYQAAHPGFVLTLIECAEVELEIDQETLIDTRMRAE